MKENDGDDRISKIKDAWISPYAYHYWEINGRPEGRDLEFWLTGEAHLVFQRRVEYFRQKDLPHGTLLENMPRREDFYKVAISSMEKEEHLYDRVRFVRKIFPFL